MLYSPVKEVLIDVLNKRMVEFSKQDGKTPLNYRCQIIIFAIDIYPGKTENQGEEDHGFILIESIFN